jgi:hypothetical protein
MGDFDRSAKWLIQHHGDALLRLSGVRDIRAWKAVQSEVVQPGQLPDGLIEARLSGSSRLCRYLVEVATYPEKRAVEQLVRGALLTRLNFGRLPEVVALVLRRKGRFRIPELLHEESEEGWTELRLRWRVVELWTLPAEELLATGEPGVMPWVPLSQFQGPPEKVIRHCRDVIETVSTEEDRVTLLAVTQVLTGLRYNDPNLLELLGGGRVMTESPLFKKLKAEWTAESIVRILEVRLGSVPDELKSAVLATRKKKELDRLFEAAARCPDLESFRAELPN